MKYSCKRLVRFAAITWIGLAGSTVAAFAVVPHFACSPGEWSGLVIQGIDDHFAGGILNPELTAPSAAFLAMPNVPVNLPTNVYDQTGSNYHFGDTLPIINPPGFPTVTKARVTIRLKVNSADANNDGINFMSQGWPAQTSPVLAEGARAGFAITSLPNAASWGAPQVGLFVFQFLPTAVGGVKVWGNGTLNSSPSSGPPYNGPNFFAALNANKRLDVHVQDDTSIDFIQLEICAQQ